MSSLFLRGAKDFRAEMPSVAPEESESLIQVVSFLDLRLIDYYRANPNELRLMGRREGRMKML